MCVHECVCMRVCVCVCARARASFCLRVGRRGVGEREAHVGERGRERVEGGSLGVSVCELRIV